MSTNNEDDLPIGIKSWWGDMYEPKCIHVWVKYEGFTERYEFCEKCDEKRPLTEDDINEKSGNSTKRTF